MDTKIEVEKVVFETPVDRGYVVKGSYLAEPKGEALVEVFKDGQPLRWFLFPAYKIWNIAAHVHDIIESEIAGDKVGYDMAAWTGFSVLPTV